ncbi:hypothetical protein ACFP81_07225 [Deinococcus lacus]|uniref:Uncharacterized protein n=1 Tax=Deinococcus lacus TaxID=392561 RepID=A0ABW1YC92_9DEIO
MSRAFVKEESGEAWTPPAQPGEYQVLYAGPGGHEKLREGDDLLELLRWVSERPNLELRDRTGLVLARSSSPHS